RPLAANPAQPLRGAEAAVLSLSREFPDNPHVRISLARLRFTQGKRSESLAILRDIEKREPDNLNALFAIATVCEAGGDLGCARGAMEKVLALDRANEAALAKLRALTR
ncbi:MAG TPA: hypothetical protein PLL10_05365, partial [Elusimicrobiales bacterium]|nr:hypothetical protein [Elusimicrobiales bacterium]